MRVAHLECGTMCPIGRRLVHEEGSLLEAARLVCHCLLVETPASGLVLVDTGLGTGDVRDPDRLALPMRLLMRPRLSLEHTALHRVRALGFDPRDVRHVVLTHLDFDHAGGLADFPQAQVHVLDAELRAASAQRIKMGHMRYRPKQWRHGPHWQRHTAPQGERWFGFEAVRDLPGLPPEILMVPLAGHTPGHAGIAIDAGGADGWLFHAGDAYFFAAEMRVEHPHCSKGLAAYQTMMEWDRAQRLHNQQRLRELIRDHGDEVTVFCAHDPQELDLLSHHRPVRDIDRAAAAAE